MGAGPQRHCPADPDGFRWAFPQLVKAEIEAATAAQALKHPNWDMGAKVTIDSASMMNKGLELIEAQQIFDVDHERLDVIVHPQSVVHSLVAYNDGGQIAQLGVPDMQTPIAAALRWPRRTRTPVPPLDLAQYGSLTFEPPDRGEPGFPVSRSPKPRCCRKAVRHRSCSTPPMKSRLAPFSMAPLPSAVFPGWSKRCCLRAAVRGRG